MDVSIIICTYNRFESLRRTLQTCCDLIIPENLTWELLVVDNNSSDTTRQVCDSFVRQLPIRYLFEPRQGKSQALNLSINESQGELLVFTDDDVDLDPGWLKALWRAAQSYTTAIFLGGKVIPRWEKTPPRWLADNSGKLLSAVTLHWDLGDTEHFFANGAGSPGANLAIRAAAFVTGVRFRQDLGPTGNNPTRHEDDELLKRLQQQGPRVSTYQLPLFFTAIPPTG